jgi:putative intracellular protease/amidase
VGGFNALGKPVAAACHGPAALLPAVDQDGKWLFDGRHVTGFTNTEEEQVGFASQARWLLEDRLSSADGSFEQSGSPWAEHVVVDGNLYTGQNPALCLPLARVLVEAPS